MKHNMTLTDRIIRVIIAVVISVLYISNMITGAWAILLMVLSIIFLLTSFINFCPLYTILGIRKWERKSKAIDH